MGFKDEIKLIAERKSEPTSLGSVRVYVSDDYIHLFWNDSNNEFEYIYSGDKTMFRWLKGKGYSDYISTPKSIKNYYKKLLIEYEKEA